MSTQVQGGNIRAAIIQFAPKSATCMEDVNYNTDRMIQFMNRAAAGFPGLDMVIFPENCFQGFSPTKFLEVALTLDSEPVRRVCEKCKDLGIWGVFNPWVKPDDGGFIENKGIIVNDEGEIVHEYVKVTPAIPFEPTRPGKAITTCKGPKGSKIALIICHDSNSLDVWREVASSDANLVIHISHWMAPYEYSHQLTNCAGAYFTRTPVLACNAVGVDESYIYAGQSLYVNPHGRILNQAPLGVEWILDVNVDPVALENATTQSITANWRWEAYHRGAGCPDTDGFGITPDFARIYNK